MRRSVAGGAADAAQPSRRSMATTPPAAARCSTIARPGLSRGSSALGRDLAVAGRADEPGRASTMRQHGPVGAPHRRARRARAGRRTAAVGRAGVVGAALLAERVLERARRAGRGRRTARRSHGSGGRPRTTTSAAPYAASTATRACACSTPASLSGRDASLGGERVARVLPGRALHRLGVPQHDGRGGVGQGERGVDERRGRRRR